MGEGERERVEGEGKMEEKVEGKMDEKVEGKMEEKVEGKMEKAEGEKRVEERVEENVIDDPTILDIPLLYSGGKGACPPGGLCPPVVYLVLTPGTGTFFSRSGEKGDSETRETSQVST